MKRTFRCESTLVLGRKFGRKVRPGACEDQRQRRRRTVEGYERCLALPASGNASEQRNPHAGMCTRSRFVAHTPDSSAKFPCRRAPDFFVRTAAGKIRRTRLVARLREYSERRAAERRVAQAEERRKNKKKSERFPHEADASDFARNAGGKGAGRRAKTPLQIDTVEIYQRHLAFFS
jgi:hypothetical protein